MRGFEVILGRSKGQKMPYPAIKLLIKARTVWLKTSDFLAPRRE